MHDHHDHFWWRFFPKKELNRIYLSVAVRSFAISLISLFLPLYLHKELGYSLNQTLIFFVMYSIAFAVSSPLAAKFSSVFGLKHSILLSVPFYLLFILLLYLLPVYTLPLAILSILLGLSMAFYWMGLHLVFYQASDHKHRGEEVGKRKGLSILSTLFGPIVGGLLIKFVGFKLVFIIVATLLFLSAFFLFLSREKHVKYHFSFSYLLNKKHWKDSIFFISRGTTVISSGVIWPLFIFFILKDYLSLGVVGSVLAGVSAILVWLIGTYSDHIKKRKIIRVVVGFEAASWFIRAFVSTITGVFGATIFGSFTSGAMESPMGALEYDKAKGKVASYFVSREIFINVGRILLLVVVLAFDSLAGGLFLNGLFSLLALLL